MRTIVADTNVLASGFVQRNPLAPPVLILDAWRDGRLTLVVSDHLLDELSRALARPYFVARLRPDQRAAITRLLRMEARLVHVTASVAGIVTHREDDEILATAVSAQAEYLVTGDVNLQRIGAYQEVLIVSPRVFCELILRDENP